MSKPSCLMAVMPDGSGLTVRVVSDKVIANVREIHHYFEEEWEGPMFEVYEKVFSQEFDFSGGTSSWTDHANWFQKICGANCKISPKARYAKRGIRPSHGLDLVSERGSKAPPSFFIYKNESRPRKRSAFGGGCTFPVVRVSLASRHLAISIYVYPLRCFGPLFSIDEPILQSENTWF
ncbi:MAG: hypothetical protein UV93_C0011G0007 [Candidatus Azambacteria bacterium GW2011_GWC2_43_27]|nr:MAG: hypothetical protein UV93_C0011G0007 [Candidatus Azambacteria bacterium GW2011_GWC2_43_27]